MTHHCGTEGHRDEWYRFCKKFLILQSDSLTVRIECVKEEFIKSWVIPSKINRLHDDSLSVKDHRINSNTNLAI